VHWSTEACNSFLVNRTISLLDDLVIGYGDRIGQLVPVQRQIMNVESIDEKKFETFAVQRKASRGAGGFGSTDNDT
jgi:dUTPase